MPVYELINPSDPYTFEAPNIEVAGVAVCMLSSHYGAKQVDGDQESTPVLFGWKEWLEDRQINGAWVESHRSEIADALDSFLIGDPASRQDVEEMLAEVPPEKREALMARRQDRHRSSMNQIGERAYEMAKHLRHDDVTPEVK